MSLERLRDEIKNDPLGRGYAGMTDEEILNSLAAQNIQKYKPITSAELLAWSAMNLRQTKIEDAAISHPSPDIKNICKVAVKMLDRDSTEFDLNKTDRQMMLGALVQGGVLDASDSAALYTLATYYISRNEQLGLGEFRNGDVIWAKNN